MKITDLNDEGAHVYRRMLDLLHSASLRLTADQMTALLEYANQEISEACMDIHNGADPKKKLLILRLASSASVNGDHYTKPFPKVPMAETEDDWARAQQSQGAHMKF